MKKDLNKRNPMWQTPKDGEYTGSGFDAKGPYLLRYNAKLGIEDRIDPNNKVDMEWRKNALKRNSP